MGKIIKIIISVLITIISLIGGIYVYKIGILPNSYIISLFITLIIINSIASLLLFRKGIIKKIISIIIYLILLTASIAIIYYSSNTVKYLDTGFSNNI